MFKTPKNKHNTLSFAVFFVLVSCFLLVLFTVLPTGVSAETNPGVGKTTIVNPINQKDLTDFVEAALEVVRNIGFVVAVIFIVYAGFLFVTAQGDESKLKRAKSAFLWAVIGTAVLIGAWVFAEALDTTIRSL